MTLAAEVRAKRPRSADLAGKRALSWRRFAKFMFGAVLLAAAVLTFYQQLVVRVSRDAVINARRAVIRAPIDGVATASGKERWIGKTAYEGTGSSGRRHLRHYCSATSAIFVELQ